MSAPTAGSEFVWIRGEGGQVPVIERPVAPASCDHESPEDSDGAFACDRFTDHDGPHAAWTSDGKIAAVWTSPVSVPSGDDQ